MLTVAGLSLPLGPQWPDDAADAEMRGQACYVWLRLSVPMGADARLLRQSQQLSPPHSPPLCVRAVSGGTLRSHSQ